jgi:uncharacterized damage-inducible protein DinB
MHEQGDSSVLTTLFRHNAWANLKLLDFCEQLSDEQLNAQAVGGFGSIRDTLQHIVAAEVSYVDRVNGKRPVAAISFDAFAGFAVLRDTVRWTSEELLALALTTRHDTLVQQRPPRSLFEYRLASLIVQVINHSTEHRTQIATIVTQLGMEPPDLSGWCFMEEIGELRELDAKS